MDHNGRAYEKIIKYIEQEVMQGRYHIGDRLPPERELALQLGASRNSVREGLCILERMGAISSQQGAGNFISDNFEQTLIEVMSLMFILEQGTFREISEFRYALEMQALMLALDRATDVEKESLLYYLTKLENEPDEDRRAYYDKKIHYTMAEASHNRFIIDNLQALTEVMDIFIKDMRARILMDSCNREGLMKQHRLIVEAILNHDPEKGKNALNKHFEYIYDYIDG